MGQPSLLHPKVAYLTECRSSHVTQIAVLSNTSLLLHTFHLRWLMVGQALVMFVWLHQTILLNFVKEAKHSNALLSENDLSVSKKRKEKENSS